MLWDKFFDFKTYFIKRKESRMSSCCYVITGHCPVHRLSVCPLAPLLKVKGGRNEELRGGEYSLNMSLTTVFPLQAAGVSTLLAPVKVKVAGPGGWWHGPP